MMIELREPMRKAGCDYFEMHRLLMKADAAVLRKYPYMPLFLYRADKEARAAGVELPADLSGAVSACRSELLAGAQRSPFLTEEDTKQISRILFYARNGLMQELLQIHGEDKIEKKNTASDGTAADTPSDGISGVLSAASEGESKDSPLPLHEAYIQGFTSCLQMMRRLNM